MVQTKVPLTAIEKSLRAHAGMADYAGGFVAHYLLPVIHPPGLTSEIQISLVSPGVDNLRWMLPVRPGDTLRAYAEIKDVKPSRSKPDRGVLTYEIGAINQRGELVMTATLMSILKRSRES